MADFNYFEDWFYETDETKRDDKMLYISTHRYVYKQFVEQAVAWKKLQVEALNQKTYAYLITFTTSPETQKGAEDFLIMQSKREALALKSFKYCKEHEDTNLHFHVYVETYKPLEKQQFKHWIKHRGYVDFKRVKPGTEEQTQQYLYKENTPVVLL